MGYGTGFAGNAHRHAPDAWLQVVRYLVEELDADLDARDYNGYTALHHAASRGDNEMILYLVAMGADVTVVSRRVRPQLIWPMGQCRGSLHFPPLLRFWNASDPRTVITAFPANTRGGSVRWFSVNFRS